MIDIKALIADNRAGRPVGLPSFCTANEHVLRANEMFEGMGLERSGGGVT